MPALHDNPSVLACNLVALQRRWPSLAARLEALPSKEHVRILRAQDGSVAYGVQQGVKVVPITDAVSPARRMQAQLDQHASTLADFTRPILLVGLYPGNELLALFDHSEKVTTPHCPQPIVVCLDSLLGMYAFLQTWDATRVLDSSRVHFFWHEEMPQFLEGLREHPERPHVFTLISGAGDNTLNKILPPLAQFIQERDQETRRLQAENRTYYDAISDAQLAKILAGKSGRKPRLLMPTATWSTFIQHSARDTCAAFEALGWETRLLRMEALLTPYHLVRQINEWKPDAFLFIDHLRYEAEEAYPRNLLFITWVQDEMAHIHCAEAGRKLAEYAATGRRDLVIGHTERLEKEFGYPADRLAQLTIPADPRVFHPVPLTDSDQAKYACELAFMSNAGMPSDEALEVKILPIVEPWGLSKSTTRAIHDHLWTAYRQGQAFINRKDFLAEMMQFPEFAALYEQKEPEPATGESRRDALLRLFLWGLNDTIYRHVVLEWADEMGMDLHLHGHGWERHPRFAKYARGPLAHGAELNVAYQAARRCLHLNIAQGMHQRLWEILAAGGRPLLRAQPPQPGETPADAMRELAKRFMEDSSLDNFSPAHQLAIEDTVAQTALSLVQADSPDLESLHDLEQRVLETLKARVLNRPEWVIPGFEACVFYDKNTFQACVRVLKTEKSI